MRKAIHSLLAIVLCLSGIMFVKSSEIREYPLIAISVKFSDQPNRHDFSWVSDQLFGQGDQSLNEFYWQCSSGRVRVVPGKFGGLSWYQAEKPLSYYAEDTKDSFDIRAYELIREAITKALDNGLNPKEYEFYDPEWEATYSQACIIVTGDQEGYKNFPRSDAFWPHASAIEVNYKGESYLFRYFLACEGLTDTDVDLNLAWTSAHEYGHVMGLWDLYDYGCGGPFGTHCTYPVTYYDIMVARHSGQGMLGYHREKLGFIKPLVVTESGEYTLKPITTNDSNSYLKVWIPGTREYLGIEYRKREGIDAFWTKIPSEGVIISRVSDDPRYGKEMNSGEDGYFLLEILNPGKTQWHEKAAYSIESGQTVASAKTSPSTMPYNPDYTGTVKVEVVSNLGDTVTARITFAPREKIQFSLNTDRVFVGRLHKSEMKILAVNRSNTPISLKGANCELEQPVSLEPGKIEDMTLGVELPSENIPKTIIDGEITLESENQFHRIKVIYVNIMMVLDKNHDGTVTADEVEAVARALGKQRKPGQDYDFDGSGKIDMGDLMIASKYVGFTQK